MGAKSSTAIVYFSKDGSTKRLAYAIATGVEQEGTVDILPIESQHIVEGRFKNTALLDKLLIADAIVFGSPTYMGGVAAQFKAFADATSRLRSTSSLANKLAAGFTTGSSIQGEQSYCMNYLFILAQQHGMLWVGMDGERRALNPNGSSTGLITYNVDGKFTTKDLICAENHGRHIASRANQYNNSYNKFKSCVS